MTKSNMSVEELIEGVWASGCYDQANGEQEAITDLSPIEPDQALDQLYEMLASGAKTYDTGMVPPQQVFEKAVPLETIKRLFGRES